MHGFHLETLKNVCVAAEKTIGNLLAMPDFPKDRMGGYLTIRDGFCDIIFITVLLGSCKAARARDYHAFSIEKAHRLFCNKGHISSWQSRVETDNMYGGAIRALSCNHIYSFSGLPELADEVVCLETAIHHGSITRDDAEGITKISNNTMYRQYLAKHV
ncbi:MAG: hypothetical protein Q7S10_02630 [bacterium]|nr:hypothetical protein [bacterium]